MGAKRPISVRARPAHRRLRRRLARRGGSPGSVRRKGRAAGPDGRDGPRRSGLRPGRELPRAASSAHAEQRGRAQGARPGAGRPWARRDRSRSARGQRIDASDVDLLAVADRLVLFVGTGELLGQMPAMARGYLDYDRAVSFLERRVALTPNNAAAHRALGRALVDHGREETDLGPRAASASTPPTSTCSPWRIAWFCSSERASCWARCPRWPEAIWTTTGP